MPQEPDLNSIGCPLPLTPSREGRGNRDPLPPCGGGLGWGGRNRNESPPPRNPLPRGEGGPQNENYSRFLVVALVGLAMAYRLAICLWLWQRNGWFFAISADEVERALLSADWWQTPQWFPALWWPPLPFWLGGFLIGSGVPAKLALSILSLAAGVLTLPVFYVCLRRCFSPVAGIIGTWLLACQPELVWLGISGLAESQLILFVTCAVTGAVIFWSTGRLGALLVGSTALCAATATRYEAWILFPFLLVWLVAGIYRLRTKRLVVRLALAALAVIVSSLFIVAWCEYQRRSHGHPLAFVDNAAQYLRGYFEPSIWLVWKYPRTLLDMAPALVFLAPVGLLNVWRERKRDVALISRPMVWLFCIFGLLFAYQLWSAVRGLIPTHNVFRTVVLPLVFLLIPLASSALRALVSGSPTAGIAAVVLATVLVTAPRLTHHPHGIVEEDIAVGRAVARNTPEEGTILVEVRPWNLHTVRLFSGCLERQRWRYDRGVGFSGRELLNDQRNPSVFRSGEELAKFLKDHDVRLVTAFSRRADAQLRRLRWRPQRVNNYSIYRPPPSPQYLKEQAAQIKSIYTLPPKPETPSAAPGKPE